MCCGMNTASRIRPGISLTSIGRGTMAAVTHPAASVASAPIDRRASIIGSVNVIASATRAYAGHDDRMMSPAAAATAIHATSPATTASTAFPIPLRIRRKPKEGRRSASWKNRPHGSLCRRPERLSRHLRDDRAEEWRPEHARAGDDRQQRLHGEILRQQVEQTAGEEARADQPSGDLPQAVALHPLPFLDDAAAFD